MAMRVAQNGVLKVVTFYKNGDKFFRGYRLAITPRRYRNMETLLNDLTRLLVLPQGARYVLTKEGKTVEDLNEFEHGQGYVCSSFPKLKNLKYGVADRLPYWNSSRQSTKEKSMRTAKLEKVKTSPVEGPTVTRRPSQSFKPKIITVIRYGHKPRRMARVLLNKRTAQTFEQVLNEVTNAIGVWGTNGIHRLYNLSGNRITDVSELFKQDDCFIAVGNERLNVSDFDEIIRETNVKPTVTQKTGLPLINNDISQLSETEQRSSQKVKRNSIKLPCIGRKFENENHTDHLKGEFKSTENKRHQRPLDTVSKEYHSSNTVSSPHNISNTPNDHSERPLGEKNKIVKQHDVDADKAKIVERQRQPLSSDRKSATGLNKLDNGETKSKPKNVEDIYTLGEKIGDGNFAVVRVGIEKLTNTTYALKIIDRKKIKGKEDMLNDEIRIMKGCFHVNIARLYDIYETPLEVYLVMELVTGGDLFDEISNSVKFEEPIASLFTRDIVNALQYLHKQNIVHRDLKPENLLVHVKDNGKKQLKLADFGLAVDVKVPLFTVCGTPTYVAPEILEETGYGIKVDIWAAGVILYIMLCGFPPFRSPNKDQDELFDLIVTGNYEFLSPYWDDISDQAKDLVSNLLVVDTRQRYTAQQTLRHPWLPAEEDRVNVDDEDVKSQPFNARRKFKGAAIAVKGSRRLKNIALDYQFKRGEKLIV